MRKGASNCGHAVVLYPGSYGIDNAVSFPAPALRDDDVEDAPKLWLLAWARPETPRSTDLCSPTAESFRYFARDLLKITQQRDELASFCLERGVDASVPRNGRHRLRKLLFSRVQ